MRISPQTLLDFCLFILLFGSMSCNSSTKEKELALKEKELELRERELKMRTGSRKNDILSTNDALRIAERKFRKYLPNIERTHGAALEYV